MNFSIRQSKRSKLLEHFMCNVCLDTVKDPRLCPSCSKMFCYECLIRCFSPSEIIIKRCPLCRHHVRDVTRFIKCNWVDQLTDDITNLDETLAVCQVHSEQLSIYCNDCKTVICSNCALFESDHVNHDLSSLKSVCRNYRREVNELKEMIQASQEKIVRSQHILRRSFHNYTKEKEQCFQQMVPSFEESLSLLYNNGKHMFTCTDNNLQKRSDKIGGALSELNDILNQPDSLELLIETKGKVAQFKHFLQTNSTAEDDLKSVASYLDKSSLINCMSLSPEYNMTVLKLYDFCSLSAKEKIIESDSLYFCNLKFKLEIHTAGLASDRNAYKQFVSMFVTFSSPENLKSTYDFCVKIGIVNHLDGNENPDKESIFLIKVGPGDRNKIYAPAIPVRLATLFHCGFLKPETSCFVVRFAMRPISYQTLAQIQQDYIIQSEMKSCPQEDSFVSATSEIGKNDRRGNFIKKCICMMRSSFVIVLVLLFYFLLYKDIEHYRSGKPY